MENQRKFRASGLVTAALVAAVMFGGAMLAAAQPGLAARSVQTRIEQETITPMPLAVGFRTLVNLSVGDTVYSGFAELANGHLIGTGGGGAYGSGLIFEMTPNGTLKTLYSFCEESGCPDGSGPGRFVLGSDGNFYGITGIGGANGVGTVFKFAGLTTLTTLHSFDRTDGTVGAGGYLVQAGGNFYGTTENGGNLTQCYDNGCGSIFEIAPSGTPFTTLYNLCSQPACADGAILFDSLVLGTDGNFYGATWGGGPGNGGTVFKMTPTGTLTTLYSFCVAYYPFCGDGDEPMGLVLGTDGNLYGTTGAGGNNYNAGSVFKITPTGTLTTIYSFCAQTGCTDGSTPRNALTLGSDGNFYGTTQYGGTHNDGTVFKLTPAGVLTRLHSFEGNDGIYPGFGGSLFEAANGTLYGTTSTGGNHGGGTIFSLDVGLTPAAEKVPTSGKVETNIVIAGK
jgi:uncharacterized repeat protein (TIGR03803 family)